MAQDVALADDEYVPAAQAVHAPALVVPEAEEYPALHWHVVAPAVAVLPVVHAVQLVAPVPAVFK